MALNRRTFLKVLGGGAAAIACKPASAETEAKATGDMMGMLVDTTECIGCRKCEWACNQQNELTNLPLEHFEETEVFAQRRRMTADAFTVVNRYDNPTNPEEPIYVKSQCMHCQHPACASACLVGALQQQENGAVTYDASKCMGCRYCMVACPFQVPAYEYDSVLAPRVRKCGFCFERATAEGKIPACAEMCPPMALTYGRRADLLELAREKMAVNPERYENRIYGEHEAGGTAWLYLASRPFEEIDFLPLDDRAYPTITEHLQHSIFKFGALPAMFFGLLGVANKMFNNVPQLDDEESHSDILNQSKEAHHE